MPKSGCGGWALGLTLVMSIVGTLMWFDERGTPFGSRHGFFGGAPLVPVSGTIVFAEGSPDAAPSSVRMVDATGGRVTDLTGGLPALGRFTSSPTGDRVAYLTGDSGRVQVRVVATDPRRPGARHVPPSGEPARSGDHDVAWAPDGSALAFIADVDPSDGGAGETLNVVQVSGDGVGPVRTVPLPVGSRRVCYVYDGRRERCETTATGEPRSVTWLPGDRGLVYTAWFGGDEELRNGVSRATSEGHGRIGRLRPDDLSAPPQYVEPGTALTLRAGSPDGRYLLFQEMDDHARVVDLQDADPMRDAVRIDRVVEGPSWSPDGRRLLFVSGRKAYLAAADGRDDHSVAHMPHLGGRSSTPPVQPEQAVWSPDSRHVAWSGSDGRGRAAVMVMNADGTGQTPVHELKGDARVLAWTASSR